MDWAPVLPILSVTFLGTVNNNIVNVPMAAILREFHAPLTEGSFVVVGWSLAIAILLASMAALRRCCRSRPAIRELPGSRARPRHPAGRPEP